MGIRDALNVAQMILAIVLIILILLQSKGSGFTGMFGGGDSSSVYRTKRGIELRMFQFTIGLSVLFFLIALINSFRWT